jgi:TRAP-type C4-dicarboxylate transport system permease small subunit
MGIIIVCAALFAIGLAGWYGYTTEKKLWNNGISPSGKPWHRVVLHMHGYRGYSDGDGNFMWVSYLDIDKDYEN